jgi:hypothetical protein
MSRVISSLRRRVSHTNGMFNAIPREPVHSTLEMDTHADKYVLGPNFVILHYTSRECDVSPYTEVYESVTAVPIVSGATAWTDKRTGLTYILVVNEALWMPDTVTSSLINPNQLRAYGITVQDNPFAGPMYISNEGEEDAVSNLNVRSGHQYIYQHSNTYTRRARLMSTHNSYIRYRVGTQRCQVPTSGRGSQGRVYGPGIGSRKNLQCDRVFTTIDS